jgi:hypothetical protein
MFALLFPQTATQIGRIEQKVEIVMAQVQVAQEDLDALDTSLDEATDAISAHIDELVAAAGEQLPEGSLTALQEDVERLRGLRAPVVEE